MKVLTVEFHGLGPAPIHMGSLAYDKGIAQFEFDAAFIARGINPSPFQLNLEPFLQAGDRDPFNGLHGLFADSLPDGWGLKVMDRAFRQAGINPQYVSPIDRLAFIGNRAMGALSYRPDEGKPLFGEDARAIDLDDMALQSIAHYQGDLAEMLDQMAINATPSGGARPKLLIGLHDNEVVTGADPFTNGYSPWLVKFPTGTTPDERADGAIEYAYAAMARNAGIQFPETKLIQGAHGNYFLTKRFDRLEKNQRVHIHSLAGLVNADFRMADFDYEQALVVCKRLTRNHSECEQLFRRMVFNILSGNRDDHTKNFSFFMNAAGEWRNTPAYDLTYNAGMNGEHTMSVAGKGKNITSAAVEHVAKAVSIQPQRAREIVYEVLEAVLVWPADAKELGVSKVKIDEIHDYMKHAAALLSG